MSSTQTDLRHFITRLALWWLVTVICIVLIALSSQVAFAVTQAQALHLNHLIDTLGEQASLSSQIALHAVQMATDDDPARHRVQIGELLDTLQQQHEMLTHISPLPPAARSVYFSQPDPLDDQLHTYYTAIETLLATDPVTLDTPELVQITAQTPLLIADFNRVEDAYLQANLANMNIVQSLNLLRVTTAVVLLLVQGVFILRPMIRQLQSEAQKLAREVSERTQTTAALHTSELRFRTLVNTAPVGIYQSNPDGNITFVNPHWLALTGLTMETATDRGWSNAIHPDDRERVYTAWYAATSARQKFELDYRYLRGSEVVYIHGTAVPVEDEAGNLIGYIGTSTDITISTMTQLALQERNRLVESIMETSVTAVTLLNKQGYIMYANNRALEILGIRAEELGHRRYNAPDWNITTFDGSPIPDEELPFQQVLRRGQLVFDMQHALETADGQRRYLSINGAPIFIDGEIHELVFSFADITERRQAERQALQLEAERQRTQVLTSFIRDTSHDLRTPITTLNTGLYLLRKTSDRQRQLERIDQMEKVLKYLTTVLDQLQHMAVLDSTDELERHPVDLSLLLPQMVSVLDLKANPHHLPLALVCPPDLPPVLATQHELEIALKHIIVNALTFTPPGGRVTVCVEQVEGRVRIKVRDTGIGIAEEHLPHLFERFYRVDQARTLTGGAGLGLSIARRIIDLHHGEITVTSTPGEGTIVRVTLPVV